MTMEDLALLNSLVARARRHLRDFDEKHDPDDYWQYDALWKELKDDWGLELPPYKGYDPTSPLKPVRSS